VEEAPFYTLYQALPIYPIIVFLTPVIRNVKAKFIYCSGYVISQLLCSFLPNRDEVNQALSHLHFLSIHDKLIGTQVTNVPSD
jgi:hypothetical protein